MTNRDFKDAFTDILRRIFCWCCSKRDDGGFPIGTGSTGLGVGAGGPMPPANTDRLNVDYV